MNGSGLRVPAFAKWVCGVLLFAGALVVCGLVLKQPALRQSSRAHAPQAGRGFVNEQRAAQHDAELHESIGGRVTSVDGGDPISGAVVRFKTSAESVLTDLDGKFLLPTRYLQSVTASRASATVLNTGSPATVSPPLPGVTPPTIRVP